MPEFIKVASTDEIQPGQGKTVEVKGEPVAVFNVNGKVYAIHNTCVHRGGPLGEGALEGDKVTCPWHGWAYDVKTGSSTTPPGQKVKSYLVKLEGKDIMVAAE